MGSNSRRFNSFVSFVIFFYVQSFVSKMFVRIANSEDQEQTAPRKSSAPRSSLILVCTVFYAFCQITSVF